MTRRPLPLFALTAAVILASAAVSAQAPPPQTPAKPSPPIIIPDSRAWSVEQAIVNLRSSDKGMRLAGLYRLFKVPGPDIQKWIAEAAQFDPEARIRYEAVKALQMRNESASLPIFMHIAETDKDDRVRTAARIASGVGGTPGAQPGEAPGQAAPTQKEAPGQPAPPPPKRFDAAGNELPPGYIDGDVGGGAKVGAGGGGTGAEVPWGEDMDPEAVAVKEEKELRAHSGFLPQLGFDGAMGSPRDTLNRSDVGLQLGLGWGRFDHAVTMNMTGDSVINGDQARGVNRFTRTDFDAKIFGHWSPGKYFEVGLSAVLTVEKMQHLQRWECLNLDGQWEKVSVADPPDPESYCHGSSDVIYQNASYGGFAFGLLSLDLKSVFLQTDLARVGVVARLTFPTHTGARFDKGLGAADLYLPGGEAKTHHYTDGGTAWGLEPGIVASFAPVQHLTVYADLTFAMAFLKFDVVSKDYGGSDSQEQKANNFFFIPHFGVQYRFLDEKLGVQVAFSPVAFLGKGGDAGLAAFAIVPGASIRLIEHLNLSLTVDIDAGANAAHPFQCPHLASDTQAQTSEPAACGVGRQVGFALQTSWQF